MSGSFSRTSGPAAAGPGVVDHTALKVNQAGIVLTVLVAFAASTLWWRVTWLIPALAVVLLAGTASPRLALFKQLYFRALKPAGLLKPHPVQESPAPHNFAQGMGGVCLAIASVLLPFAPAAGLAVALLVGVLAFVNVAFGYCVGCQIYFQLARRGLIAA